MSSRIRTMMRIVPSIASLLDLFDTVSAVAIRVPRRGAVESRRKRVV
ncbi:hypothetical protein [Burkholderia cenocepacia]|nr:hypothetical protein [Burkholderia cenocepacia]